MLKAEHIKENGFLVSPDGGIYKIISYQTTPKIKILNILTQEEVEYPITSQKIKNYRAITQGQLMKAIDVLERKGRRHGYVD